MITTENLVCGYGNNFRLSPISLTINKNMLYSFIGRNGAGKSTILKTIAGIIPRISGNILLDGQNIDSLTNKKKAKIIAYGSQRNNLPGITVGALVLHGRFPHLSFPKRISNKDMEIAKTSMETIGILDLENKYLKDLSGGEAQKAYLAMLLAQEADILILDEPTTYLDLCFQFELITLLKNLTLNGKTIVMAIHDLPLALKFSDNICLIHDCNLVFSGTPTQLTNTHFLESIFKYPIV